jgi:low affinity Fe/Cu permease
MKTQSTVFSHFANLVSQKTGHPMTFMIACGLIAVWGITGPIFNFSDTWQLVINTSTTIITFLMVFLIQNTQGRDNAAIQIKLDELIRAMSGASNSLLCIEELTEEELIQLKKRYTELANQALKDVRANRKKP